MNLNNSKTDYTKLMKYEKIKTENQNNLQKILTFQAFLAYNTNQ